MAVAPNGQEMPAGPHVQADYHAEEWDQFTGIIESQAEALRERAQQRHGQGVGITLVERTWRQLSLSHCHDETLIEDIDRSALNLLEEFLALYNLLGIAFHTRNPAPAGKSPPALSTRVG